MSFLSKLVKPYRKGEKNFARGRAAEQRGDFAKAEEYFREGATAFDEHLADKQARGEIARPSHLVMAGICYTRIARFEDGLRVLDACLAEKDIPDAYLNAGYAAARLGRTDRAVGYWKDYPAWADQRILQTTLKEQVRLLSSDTVPDLGAACRAVDQAVQEQDKFNIRDRSFRELGKRTSEFRQGY